MPRIYADAYENGLEPTKQSMVSVVRRTKSNRIIRRKAAQTLCRHAGRSLIHLSNGRFSQSENRPLLLGSAFQNKSVY